MEQKNTNRFFFLKCLNFQLSIIHYLVLTIWLSTDTSRKYLSTKTIIEYFYSSTLQNCIVFSVVCVTTKLRPAGHLLTKFIKNEYMTF